ncbi:kinase-like domain-containing protein [Stachybotrys elegans]|uniref:Kinase-like domain-containing protein n=1 Tax=Stachybotrys elegans TaxID=80388 RepID=A0A8K0WS44_9HYPO|nr:kinase-like domain-containing protein [Stachybotrys elegans]
MIHHTHPGMSHGNIVRVTVQMADALQYLHDQEKQFHSDFKPLNILVRRLEPIDVVLADCADMQATKAPRKSEAQCTQQYRSPEIVKRNRHQGPPDDIWALGVSVLGMMVQQPKMPYGEMNEYPKMCFEHLQNLLALNPQHDLLVLVKGMLEWNVEDRATAAACHTMAQCLLPMGGEWKVQGRRKGDHLGIIAPKEFRPITFW